MVTLVLIASLVLQFVAVYLSLRLFKLSGKRVAGSFMVMAIALMALRQMVSLGEMFGDDPVIPDLHFELITLAISVLMAVGLVRITPIIIATQAAIKRQKAQDARYQTIFENSSISIWEEDFSAIKILFDRLRREGVDEIEAYFEQQPDIVFQCADLVKIIDLNQAALTLHGAHSKEALLAGLASTFTPESFDTFRQELVCLWRGETAMSLDAIVKTLAGEPRHVTVDFAISPGYEETLGKVIVSLVDITERKLAEDALRREKTLLNRIMVTSPVGIAVVNREGRITFANPQAETILGLSKEEITQRSYNAPEWQSTTVSGSPLPDEEQPFSCVMATRQPVFGIQHGIRWPDGHQILLSVNGAPIFDEQQEIEAVVFAIDDITERKQAEEKLLRSEQNLVESQRIARMGSWHMDLATHEVFWSEELYRMYGFDPVLPPPLYTDSMKLFTPESWERLSTAIERAIATGEPYVLELELVNKAGVTKWMLARGELVQNESGKAVAVRGIVMDITVRKQAEEELRRSEQGLAEAQRIAHLGSWELDLVNDTLIWSDEIFHIFEIDKQQFGASYEAFLEAIHPDDRERVNNAYTESLKTKKPYHIVHRLQMEDGRIKYVSERCETFFDAADKPLRSVGTVQDITEAKLREDELRRYRDHLSEEVHQRTEELRLARDAAESANKAKSVFLANMSHELRTPLNAILGFSRMMQRDSGLSESQQQTLNIINNSGEHLLKLINDVLEIAKIEAGKLQLEIAAFDLHSLVGEVTEMMRLRAQQKGLQLDLDQSAEFPRYIRGDEARIRQILVNLVSNAVKFTYAGKVTIRLGIKNHAEHQLLIEVEDTGPGISEANQKRLFNPFVQLPSGAPQEGTGLGLSIVQQFVSLMHGKIRVDSEPDKGSTFRVELPLERVNEVEVIRLGEERHGEVIGLAPGEPSYRILIVEDQHDNQLLMTQLMTRIGMEVRTASDGEECVKLFQKWKPDLIWMDWRMPFMDGVEATRRIRKMSGGKQVKIIAITASAFKEQQQELLDGGMDGFVRKPFHFAEIYESLSQHLGVKLLYSDASFDDERESTNLTSARFAGLDDQLVTTLREALDTLDSRRIEEVIRLVAEQDHSLARTLKHLAENYDYPTILHALGDSPAASNR